MSTYTDLYTNPEVQRTLDKLVDSRVYVCATDIVEYILQKAGYEGDDDAPFTYDDIENIYLDYSEQIDELSDEILKLEEEQTKFADEEPCQEDDESDEDFDKRYDKWDKKYEEFTERINELEDKQSDLEDAQTTPQEAYEWWEVERGFADELYERGEIVIRGWHNYWGRQCTGQAIFMDHIIFEIADDWGWLDEFKEEKGE